MAQRKVRRRRSGKLVPDPTPLSLRIRRAKESSGLGTDVAFANACGMLDGRTYWRYAHDNVVPSSAMLATIARVGGVSLDWLISGEAIGAAKGAA